MDTLVTPWRSVFTGGESLVSGYIRASVLITIAGKLLGLQLLLSEALLSASKEQFH
jgi:hypothetical protein